MPDHAPRAMTGLEHLTAAGRRGKPLGPAGLSLSLRQGLALSSMAARKDAAEALRDRVRAAYVAELPTRPRWTRGERLAFAWSGPGQWLVQAEGMDGAALETELRTTLSPLASICDQSDGRTLLRLAGPAARSVLAKGMPIDLHPSAFAPGHVAMTLYGHLTVTIWQIDDQPTYDIAVFRSYAADLWRHLAEAGAEYGVDVSHAG